MILTIHLDAIVQKQDSQELYKTLSIAKLNNEWKKELLLQKNT